MLEQLLGEDLNRSTSLFLAVLASLVEGSNWVPDFLALLFALTLSAYLAYMYVCPEASEYICISLLVFYGEEANFLEYWSRQI